MRVDAYRTVLARPGMGPLLLLGLFVKVAVVAIPVVINLHVVLGLGYGFGAAGLVVAAWTIGCAIGGPLQGRVMDKRGVRPTLAAAVVFQLAFWGLAPTMSYGVLIVGSVGSGLLNVQGFSIVRLGVAVSLPETQRHAGFALDSITSNISYMVGPALGVLLATNISTSVSMRALGLVVAIAGTALAVLNPQVRDTTKSDTGDSVRLSFRERFGGMVFPVMAATMATTFVISGYEIAITGSLREAGQVQWVGFVMTVCGVCSLVGALVYGTLSRPPSAGVIALSLGLTTVPAGLTADWRWLCLAMIVPALLVSPAFAATAQAASVLGPAGQRGFVMGVYSAALTLGNSVGAPLSGAVLDNTSPFWAFTVIGLTGAALAGLALLSGRRLSRTRRPDPHQATTTADTPA
ncbi:hypothetical protein ACM01_29350 [Streptomyces viridochromogenes]|uniref:MFS transporter n=2 Tax=Streptomyces viridochromogenes TaxID=1938 RepID=A0A0J7Z616_STRVR|nr:hypothetical protein ACM01_29350 [Streptomyces viridochromogenes]